MNRTCTRCAHLALALLVLLSFNRATIAADPQGADGAGALQTLRFDVDGAAREALLHAPPPARSADTPLVFVFHGHGGTARGAVRSFALERHWPEALSVYMQGLNTPGRLTDPEGKRPGWQQRAGDQNDRDLKFFDAVLARLRQEYRVAPGQIHCTGHSNGGAFTYLLWAERGSVFASVAPSGSAAAQSLPKLAPKPVMHIAGETDPLVKFEWQRHTMEALRKLNGCDPLGKAWATNCTLYPSSGGAAVVTFIHPGGHRFPEEAVPLIVRFFKENSAPASTRKAPPIAPR